MSPARSPAFIDTIEQLARAARADEMPDVLLRPVLATDFEACGAGVRAKLKPFTASSTALKFVELPARAPNPERVRRWLETSAPHISMLFSPLSQRGPPTP